MTAAPGFRLLESLAFPVERSAGRRYPEPPHLYRGEFQRDRDRIIHSRAFRRLENKTQVFAPGVSDHFRNRLTHTIEVAQVARTVAAALGLNEDLTEALALVHDVGHPPFAHAGEEELKRQMQRFGETFDHNVHGLRIVDAFEQRYVRFPGLNLTFEVREGILKHSRDLTPGADPAMEEYLPASRPVIEAQLIDLADEIAYNAADLDDAHSAQMFEIGELRAAVPEIHAAYENLELQFPGAPERVLFQESVRALIDDLVSGLVEGTAAEAQKAGLRDACAARSLPHRVAAFTPAARETTSRLKQFLRERVYFAEPLVSGRRRSAAMIAELFEHFLAHPADLPQNYVEELRHQPLHRIVCDYVAGMTDGFFLRTYEHALDITRRE